jgi:hypothetical protein
LAPGDGRLERAGGADDPGRGRLELGDGQGALRSALSSELRSSWSTSTTAATANSATATTIEPPAARISRARSVLGKAASRPELRVNAMFSRS